MQTVMVQRNNDKVEAVQPCMLSDLVAVIHFERTQLQGKGTVDMLESLCHKWNLF